MFSRTAAIMICATGLSGCAAPSKSCCGPCDSQSKACCGEAVTARDDKPRGVTVLGDDLAPLRDAFNAQSDRWRAVALVSPTCSECVYGAEATQKEITGRFPFDRVSTLCVWIPMLSTDNEQAARSFNHVRFTAPRPNRERRRDLVRAWTPKPNLHAATAGA